LLAVSYLPQAPLPPGAACSTRSGCKMEVQRAGCCRRCRVSCCCPHRCQWRGSCVRRRPSADLQGTCAAASPSTRHSRPPNRLQTKSDLHFFLSRPSRPRSGQHGRGSGAQHPRPRRASPAHRGKELLKPSLRDAIRSGGATGGASARACSITPCAACMPISVTHPLPFPRLQATAAPSPRLPSRAASVRMSAAAAAAAPAAEVAAPPSLPFRVGHGFDLHRLAEGYKLIIGGVDIPHTKGCEAHSDGDVLLHTVTDAILGALCMPDIGGWQGVAAAAPGSPRVCWWSGVSSPSPPPPPTCERLAASPRCTALLPPSLSE
jgi:hypothetical protein